MMQSVGRSRSTSLEVEVLGGWKNEPIRGEPIIPDSYLHSFGSSFVFIF